jgi:hypothetical protein
MLAIGVALFWMTGCTHPPSPDVIRSETVPTASPHVETVWVAPARDMQEYKIKAARKIHQLNPQLAFNGPLPDPLASIPVLLVHLNADGTVRRIEVLRTPHFFPHTVQLAKRAVERAQPFDSVAHLPKPWQFSETFLFNDDLKFQLRTLVELTAQN